MSALVLTALSKRFGTTCAVDDITLTIPQNAFFSILGPSGCGKSTLLRLIAGLERPDKGTITIDGQDMTHVPAYRRPTNMIFQDYALFPHLSVADNIAYGLHNDNLSRTQINQRVTDAMALVRIEPYRARRPHQLSGGQRQRTALARALVKRPKILLLDEPLSALDRQLREIMREELVRLKDHLGITFVFVTHDQDDALCLSDHIAVMFDGQCKQTATPQELYHRPRNIEIATFMGKMNTFKAQVIDDDPHNPRLDCDQLGSWHIDPTRADTTPGDCMIGLRPESLRLCRSHDDADITTPGHIERVSFLGDRSLIHARLSRGASILVSHTHPAIEGQQEVLVGFSREDVLILNNEDP
ncbi:MAG: ABC transporter ATP-binding protein [Pseudomonadota bacterium]